MGRFNLAIIIPAYNEAATIEQVVRKVCPFGRVIVVSDGSKDQTATLARQAGAIVVDLPQNRGYDGALDAGFETAATLDVDGMLTMDADGQHPEQLIPAFIEKLSTTADVVVGTRDRQQRLGETITCWVGKFLGIGDPLCGMKGYRRAVYKALGHFDRQKSIGTELLLFAAKNGFKIEQINVLTRPRIGLSRFGGSYRANLAILKALCKAILRYIGGRPVTASSPSQKLYDILSRRMLPQTWPKSRIQFELLCLNPSVDPATLTRRELYLDQPMLAQHLSSLSSHMGAIGSWWRTRFVLHTAHRIARRLGRKYSARFGIDPNTLAEAWYTNILTEFCTLIPLRHVARLLAKNYPGSPVLIPIKRTNLIYLGAWDANDFEPMYLASELQRRGVPVAFVLTDTDLLQQISTIDHFAFTFCPHGVWKSTHVDTSRPVRTGIIPQALVSAYIRGIDKILPTLDHPLNVSSSFGIGPQHPYDVTLIDPNCFSDFAANISRQTLDHADLLPGSLFSFTLPHVDFGEWLAAAFGKACVAATERARKLVAEHHIREAHICDFFFFSSAFLADAVRAQGGKIVLWPHSTNAAYEDFHLPGRAHTVYSVTKPAEENWRKHQPNIDYKTRSDLMLLPASEPQKLVPSEPLHVVVFGGEPMMRCLPILDEIQYRESYRRLYAALSLMPNVRFVFKPRYPTDTTAWLKSILPPDADFIETEVHATKMDFPNMIFLSIGFGSTAILEGIGRGIPGMIVRDFRVEDYTDIDPLYVKTDTVDAIVTEIQRCSDATYMQFLAQSQVNWYRHITDFSH